MLKTREGRQSFPSGHSVVSFYHAMCMVLYQTHRLRARRWGAAVVVFLRAIWFIWATYCSMLRLNDQRHHLEDVIVGGAVGVVVAWFIVAALSRKFYVLVDAKGQSPEGHAEKLELESVVSPNAAS